LQAIYSHEFLEECKVEGLHEALDIHHAAYGMHQWCARNQKRRIHQ
jgi:hypothetical protein